MIKKLLTFILFYLLINSSLLSQITFVKKYSEKYNLTGYDLIQLDNNSYILGASKTMYNYNYDSLRPILYKIDSLGQIIDKQTTLISKPVDAYCDLIRISDSSFCVFEAINDSANNNDNIYYFKIKHFDKDFNITKEFQYNFPTDTLENGASYLRYKNDNYIIFGSYTSKDRYIILINNDTTIFKIFNGIKDVQIYNDNYFYFTKSFEGELSGNNGLILYKVNINNFEIEDSCLLEHYYRNIFRQFFKIYNNKLYLSNIIEGGNIQLLKIDTNLNVIEEKEVSSDNEAQQVFTEGMTDIKAGCFYTLLSQNYASAFIVSKFDTNFNLIYQKFIHLDEMGAIIQSITATNDGGCVVNLCNFYSPRKITLYKFDANGNLPTSISNPAIKVSDFAVYPNPASDFINIKKAVQIEQADFILYNQLGQKTLQHSLNENITNVNIQNLSAGNYVYNIIQNGKIIDSGKIVKQK